MRHVHRTSGRDRTGVVVAAVLVAAGVPDNVIVEEYMLSAGAERARMVGSLKGLRSSSVCSAQTRDALRAALCRNA